MAQAMQLQAVCRVVDLSSKAAIAQPLKLRTSTAPECRLANVRIVASSAKKPAKGEVRVAGLAAALSALSLARADSAKAVDAEQVTSALNQAEQIYKQASVAAVTSFGVAKELVDKAVEVSKPAIEAATPVVKQALVTAVDAAKPLAEQATQALKDSGVDTAPIVDAAKTAADVAGDLTAQTSKVITAATPAAESTLETLLAQDPSILLAGGGGLVLLYLAAPSLAKGFSYAVRGFAGELTAAQTLDLLSSSDWTLVDIRSEREKAKSGLPSLPRPAKKKFVTIPLEEVPSKLRGQIRNARKVEAELTAIKIASLKRISKGSKIVLLDSYGGSAKAVAKALSGLGFSKAYIVKDGVDGGSGWIQSQLATEPYESREISPSSVIPAAARAFRARPSNAELVDVQPSRRGGLFLPAARED